MSNVPPPKLSPTVDRSRAWVCLTTNLLVCPGIGSLLAGRRIGYAELAAALAGAGWMAFVLVRMFSHWVQLMTPPPDWQDYLRSGVGGLTLFMASWFWSLLTSLRILREAKPAQPSPPAKRDA